MSNSISGNAGAAAVTVTLSGAGSASTTSASDGTYSFAGLSAGAYVVTPTMTGITFTPAFLNETIVAASITAVNFVAQPTRYVQVPTVVDNFHRANSPNLGSKWTVQTLTNIPIPIVSNQATGDPSLGQAAEMYSGASFPNDQFAALTIGAFAIESQYFVLVRTDITELTGYAGSIEGDGMGGYFATIDDQGNGEAQIGTTVTLSGAPQPGDILSLQAVGTLVTMFYNGVPIVSATSSTTASGTVAMDITATATQTDTSVSLFAAGSVTGSLLAPRASLPIFGTNKGPIIL